MPECNRNDRIRKQVGPKAKDGLDGLHIKRREVELEAKDGHIRKQVEPKAKDGLHVESYTVLYAHLRCPYYKHRTPRNQSTE